MPQLRHVLIDRVQREPDRLVLVARAAASAVPCPGGGTTSASVHGYERSLRDTPLAGMPVLIRLRVRRFRCRSGGCGRRTFVEQILGLTTPPARHTAKLRVALAAIAVALAGPAGARLATTLGMLAGRDTLLRSLRAVPDPDVGDIAVSGVDDFALRRGHVCATILLDMAAHRAVDVLPAVTVNCSPSDYVPTPGVRVICSAAVPASCTRPAVS